MTKLQEETIRKQGEMMVIMRALLANADKRLDCLVKYWETEADLESITLDDGAFASAWREQYYALLNNLDKNKLR